MGLRVCPQREMRIRGAGLFREGPPPSGGTLRERSTLWYQRTNSVVKSKGLAANDSLLDFRERRVQRTEQRWQVIGAGSGRE